MKKRVCIVVACIVVIISVALGYKALRVEKYDVDLNDWSSAYVEIEDGTWMVKEGDVPASKIDLIYGPYMHLDKGKYIVKIQYNTTFDQTMRINSNSYNDFIYAEENDLVLSSKRKSFKESVIVNKSIDDFEIVVTYTGKGDFEINGIEICEDGSSYWYCLGYIWIVVACGCSLWYIFKSLKSKKIFTLLAAIEIALSVAFPCFVIVSGGISYPTNINDWKSKDFQKNETGNGWCLVNDTNKTNETVEMSTKLFPKLDKGMYWVEIDYSSEQPEVFYFVVESKLYSAVSDFMTFSTEDKSMSYLYRTNRDYSELNLLVDYKSDNSLYIYDIRIKRQISYFTYILIGLCILASNCILLLILKGILTFNKGEKKYILSWIVMYIVLLATFSYIWTNRNFGNITMEEIVFTLNMPLEGASSSLKDYFLTAAIPSVGLYIVLIILSVVSKNKIILLCISDKKKIRLRPFVLLVWFVLLGIVFSNNFSLGEYVSNQLSTSNFIEEEYVASESVTITFPENKRNLIYIYVESAETTLQSTEEGGIFDENYIPELTKLAEENISFSQSDKLEGAAVAPSCGWTMAGLVAETSGLPLKLFTVESEAVDNSMGGYEEFLPGVVSLGDILEDNGYKNYFMCGSDISFGGRDKYFEQHGNYKCLDYYSAVDDGIIERDYKVWWGMEDQKLFDYAKEKIKEISENNEPFNFSLLTVDTHATGGYVCELCEDKYSSTYANVWACESKQIYEFVEWIKEQEFYENTTIVICGDHCSMDADFFGDLVSDKHNGDTERKVYNTIINSAVEASAQKNRAFTTLDMYPTTLAALGVKIEGERLGLGTNLFSDRKTLSEEYGYEKEYEELAKKSKYYNKEFLYKQK